MDLSAPVKGAARVPSVDAAATVDRVPQADDGAVIVTVPLRTEDAVVRKANAALRVSDAASPTLNQRRSHLPTLAAAASSVLTRSWC